MIGKLNHVAIAVPDLEAASDLYRKTFGADVSEPLELPEHGVTTVFVNLPNTKIELLLRYLGNWLVFKDPPMLLLLLLLQNRILEL